MAKHRNLLRALLHEGRTEGLFALARLGGDPLSLHIEGLNIVTASVLASVPQADKLRLVRRVGDLVPDSRYGELFTRPFRSLHPQKARELEASGLVLTEDVVRAHAAWWDLYDLLFSALAIDLGCEILAYALARGLSPRAEDFSRLKSCAAGHGTHGPREVDAYLDHALGLDGKDGKARENGR